MISQTLDKALMSQQHTVGDESTVWGSVMSQQAGRDESATEWDESAMGESQQWAVMSQPLAVMSQLWAVMSQPQAIDKFGNKP